MCLKSNDKIFTIFYNLDVVSVIMIRYHDVISGESPGFMINLGDLREVNTAISSIESGRSMRGVKLGIGYLDIVSDHEILTYYYPGPDEIEVEFGINKALLLRLLKEFNIMVMNNENAILYVYSDGTVSKSLY